MFDNFTSLSKVCQILSEIILDVKARYYVMDVIESPEFQKTHQLISYESVPSCLVDMVVKYGYGDVNYTLGQLGKMHKEEAKKDDENGE